MRAAALVAVALPRGAAAYDNGAPHSRMPALGWSSWVALGPGWPGPGAKHPVFDFCDEGSIMASVDAFLSVGLYKAGYRHFHLDDCWAGGRNETGFLYPEKDHFPNGIKPVIDYTHSKGLTFGLYTCGGPHTCVGGRPGSEGHWDQDAAVFAEWGVDWVKMDWCGGKGKPEDVYPLMSTAMNKTGRHMHFNMCEWGQDDPYKWGPAVAQSWRMGGDHTPVWDSTKSIIAQRTKIPAEFGGTEYAWNDMDMLETGNYAQAAHANGREGTMTATEYKTEFSMWAILASPLTVTTPIVNCSSGACVPSITPLQQEILLNTDVIAINQDVTPAGRLVSSSLADEPAPFAPERGAADDCKLTRKLSSAACAEGTSFFCFPNKTMYVTGGCRGVFECDGVPNVECNVMGCDSKRCWCPCVPPTPQPPTPAPTPAPPTPAPPPAPAMVYARNLTGGDVAVAFYNENNFEGLGSVDFTTLGLAAGTTATVRDLWAHKDLGTFTGRYPASGTVPVAQHETIVLRVSPKKA